MVDNIYNIFNISEIHVQSYLREKPDLRSKLRKNNLRITGGFGDLKDLETFLYWSNIIRGVAMYPPPPRHCSLSIWTLSLQHCTLYRPLVRTPKGGGGWSYSGGKVDLKPKGGLIWEKGGPLYYTLWSLWPKGGSLGPPDQTPPPRRGYRGFFWVLGPPPPTAVCNIFFYIQTHRC